MNPLKIKAAHTDRLIDFNLSTTEEIRMAIRQMKNGKTAGPGNMPTEALKLHRGKPYFGILKRSGKEEGQRTLYTGYQKDELQLEGAGNDFPGQEWIKNAGERPMLVQEEKKAKVSKAILILLLLGRQPEGLYWKLNALNIKFLTDLMAIDNQVITRD
ncbi:unnamed protein product [Schistosoma margrebowiei]|uniref:Uncharacterized protein n=1 Tax=Schistosoma margrebowiei TaxID=48269 RepID=A0A183MQ11_9TREM|nr:unnamed protein product [Schistosoma margrebowiei]